MKPIVALALLLLLAGCTAPQHSPAASAKPVSSAPHVFSATGPSQQTVTVPPGAKSAEISITCGSSDSGFVSIGVNDQDQTRDGRCPLTMRFRMAVGHTIDLSIGFGHGTGRSVTEVRFSAAPFVSDQKVTDQCTGVGGAFSDMASAVNGYANGELDLAGWQKLMVSAGDKLKGVDDSGAVGTQLTALSDWYGGSELSPTHPSSDDANNASEIVNNLCLDNGTPLVISSQYGG